MTPTIETVIRTNPTRGTLMAIWLAEMTAKCLADARVDGMIASMRARVNGTCPDGLAAFDHESTVLSAINRSADNRPVDGAISALEFARHIALRHTILGHSLPLYHEEREAESRMVDLIRGIDSLMNAVAHAQVDRLSETGELVAAIEARESEDLLVIEFRAQVDSLVEFALTAGWV